MAEDDTKISTQMHLTCDYAQLKLMHETVENFHANMINIRERKKSPRGESEIHNHSAASSCDNAN